MICCNWRAHQHSSCHVITVNDGASDVLHRMFGRLKEAAKMAGDWSASCSTIALRTSGVAVAVCIDDDL